MQQYQRKLSKGKRWYYKFTYLGTTYFSKAIYLTKQEAAKSERNRYKEIEKRASSVNINQEMNLLELINLRLDYIKATKTEKYYRDSCRYFKILYEHFSDIKVNNVSKNAVQSLLIKISEGLKKEDKDNYSVNAMIRSFKALFFYGIN